LVASTLPWAAHRCTVRTDTPSACAASRVDISVPSGSGSRASISASRASSCSRSASSASMSGSAGAVM